MGKYILFESLGTGSMGQVHRARTFGPGGVVKDLCIKQIRAKRLTKSGALERFVSEARLSMRLAHANIVPVFDFGRSGDEYFLAMEWVDGTDLRRLLDEGNKVNRPISAVVAAHVAAEVARALDYAHHLDGHPIVHRDVKPANVLISRSGDVRLTDFGVAVAVGEERAGVGGTPGYMAPEQWRRGAVDGRADLYSLGRILVQTLTGELPEDERAEAVAWDRVPSDLVPLLRTLLSEEPEGRPGRAREVADSLEGFVARARAAGGRAPRDMLAERAADAASTRRHAQPDGAGPKSFVAEATGQFTPDLSYVEFGDAPSFVTAMTKVVGPDDEEAGSDIARAATMPAVEPVGTGKAFGRYTLCAEIASGGMATVFLAKAEGPAGFEKLVALKRIHPHLAKETAFVEMFLDEARIASRINHPNVCSVFDFGRVDGVYYIAMEFIQGETLGTLMDKLEEDTAERMSAGWPGLVARIIADACEGLHAAHDLKSDSGAPLDVVHRDVSPQNLFLGYDGNVTIVDFGIARAAGRLHQTKTGAMKGKLAYVSPEQCKRQDLDRRVDVWSLGIVLWELLTCRPLFRRNSDPDTLMAVLDDPIPPPSQHNESVPPELDAIVLKALSRDRDARYPTARELGRDLSRFVASCPEPVSRADLAEWMERVFETEFRHLEDIVAHVRAPDAHTGTQNLADDELVEMRPPVERNLSISLDEHSPGRALLWIAVAVLVAIGGGWAGGTLLAGGEAPAGATLAPEAAEDENREDPGQPVPQDVENAAQGDFEQELYQNEVPEEALEEAVQLAEEATEHTEEATELAEENIEEGPAIAEADIEEGPTIAEADIEEPSQPARRRRGRVSIATPGGWADVYLGAHRVGRAPGTIRLPPGRYRLRLMPFGEGPAKSATVRVPAGGRTRLIVPLNR